MVCEVKKINFPLRKPDSNKIKYQVHDNDIFKMSHKETIETVSNTKWFTISIQLFLNNRETCLKKKRIIFKKKLCLMQVDKKIITCF